MPTIRGPARRGPEAEDEEQEDQHDGQHEQLDALQILLGRIP
jgi:hypothetical protein